MFVEGTRHHEPTFVVGIMRGGSLEAGLTVADLRAVADQLDLDRDRVAAATTRAQQAETRLADVSELRAWLDELGYDTPAVNARLRAAAARDQETP